MSVRRLDSTGEPVFGRITSILPAGSLEVLSLVNMNLKLFSGEWFLDQTVGITLFGDDEQLLASEIKRVILSVNGVSSLLSFNLALDHETRRFAVEASYSDVYGEAIPLNVVLP